MFDFMSMSNGVAVMQSGVSEHEVCMPLMHVEVWTKLTRERVDMCQSTKLARAAQRCGTLFVDDEATIAGCSAGAEIAVLTTANICGGLRTTTYGNGPAHRYEAR